MGGLVGCGEIGWVGMGRFWRFCCGFFIFCFFWVGFGSVFSIFMGRDGMGWAGIRLGWICYLSGFSLWQRCPHVTQVFSTLRTYRTFISRKKTASVALMSLDLHLGCGKSLISIKELGQQSHYSTRTLSILCWGVSQPSCRARLVCQCKKRPLSS